MTFLDRLHRHLRWLEIQNLPVLIVATQGLIYIWARFQIGNINWLTFDSFLIFQQHEYWRLLTFLFVPAGIESYALVAREVIRVFFFLLIIYWFGSRLEDEWGSFRFTLFFILGALGTILAAVISGGGGATYLYMTFTLAMARVDPNFELFLFPLPIPIKIKWIALLMWIGFGFRFLTGGFQVKMAILAALLNYLLFFGSSHLDSIRAYVRRQNFKRKMRD